MLEWYVGTEGVTRGSRAWAATGILTALGFQIPRCLLGKSPGTMDTLGQEGNWRQTFSAHVRKLPRVGFLLPLGYVQISFGRT